MYSDNKNFKSYGQSNDCAFKTKKKEYIKRYMFSFHGDTQFVDHSPEIHLHITRPCIMIFIFYTMHTCIFSRVYILKYYAHDNG
jgi:hypothetical protein